MKVLLVPLWLGLAALVCTGAARPTVSDDRVINAMLDAWHDAAHTGDADQYFSRFTEDGVFLGTDATERWTTSEFIAFGKPYFEDGHGWTLRPVSRELVVHGDTAWFDEVLDTPHMGECRGSGVLVRTGERDQATDGWRIAHYNLTVPVPNALLPEVVRMIAGEQPAPSNAPVDLSVMSFNIRYANPRDGENRWSERRDLMIDVLRQHAPDVAGLQEALAHQLDAITEALPRYRSVGVGRDDGERKGEFSPILYDADRLDVEGSGTFWFSETPNEPGSTSYGNRIPRICTWARFTDRATRRSFVLYNVHLDHESAPSRLQSCRQLAAHIAEQAHEVPVIVTGDFNADESSDPMGVMTDRNGARLLDSFRVALPDAEPSGTFNGWSGRNSGAKIDYVLVDEGVEVLGAAIVRDHDVTTGRYPSDHYPVTGRLRLRPIESD